MYAIFNDQSFNDTLTNDINSFEQLGPDLWGYTSKDGNVSCEKMGVMALGIKSLSLRVVSQQCFLNQSKEIIRFGFDAFLSALALGTNFCSSELFSSYIF